jgi:ribosomal protein S1
MVEIGSTIQAQVSRIENFGLFLKYNAETVCVLIPEVSWRPVSDLHQRFRVGDVVDVYVTHYNYGKREIVGSIRRLHPEDNPYRELSRLEPGEALHGQVISTAGDMVTVELSNDVRGHIAKHRLRMDLKKGDPVDVTVASLDVDSAMLYLDLARTKGDAVNGPTEARVSSHGS